MANNDGNVPVVPVVPPPPAIQPQIPPVAPVNNPPAVQINVPHAQAVQGPNGLQLRVEKAKLPEFWGQKDKDSIPAAEFAKRIDWNVQANGWTDEEAYSNFGMALRGSADIWLESMITLQKIQGARAHWSIIKPFFKAEFAIQTDDKLILDGLAHMAMKKTENVHDYFGRLNKTNNIIMEGKCQYTLLPPKPVVQANGFLDTAEFDAYYDIRDKAIGEFYLLDLFRAGLPTELKRVINLQSLNELDLYNAVKLATIESLSREEGKASSQIFSIEDETEDAVDAVTFRQQKPSNQASHGQNRNFRGNNRGASSNANKENPYSWRNPNQQQSGNNSNRNKQVCVFCKIPNHRQEECRKRINANMPCLDTQGRPFWPKVNSATDVKPGQVPAPVQSLEDFQF
jgi:hypothetical protein